jgi:hypothetical protein
VTTEDMDRRVLRLLQMAGASRACELATLIGVPTGEVAASLARLRGLGQAQELPQGMAQPRWIAVE